MHVLVVFAAKVGGRWNSETAQVAWVRRWSAILACTAVRAFCVSLLDCRPPGGTGESIPSVHEVMREGRFQFVY